MTSTETSREQLLTLKVMQLSRPKLADAVTFPVDDAGDDQWGAAIERAVCARTGQDNCWEPLTRSLILPQNFDNIYLGETFTFYVCVYNESVQMAKDVLIKTELQTTSQRVSLPCRLSDTPSDVGPDQSVGQVVSHEIKESGLCGKLRIGEWGEDVFSEILQISRLQTDRRSDKILQCRAIFFAWPIGEQQLSGVLHDTIDFQDNLNNDVYLEAQIQNTCTLAMVLEKVTLEPSEYYTAKEIAPSTVEEEDRSSSSSGLLNPQDIRQFLYCLSPKTVDFSPQTYRGVTSIGKLDMVWRTSMGERGRLQTSGLQRMAPGYGVLRLTVEELPANVKLRQPFKIVCRLHNCCERPLDLVLTLDGSQQNNLLFISPSGVQLGQLLPNSSCDFTVEILPLVTGLQSISGMRVVDTFLNRTHEHDEIAQVFVC